MRTLQKTRRKWREAQLFARAMASDSHPIVAQIIPIRRCNLACTYCNEFDKHSPPVPTDEMFRRLDKLAELGTSIITFSGGEPMLHPDLDRLIARTRRNGAVVTIITNGYLLTPRRIEQLNDSGLDYLQISIDNVMPDEVSKKSLKVLDQKLQWLAKYAGFEVTINSVLGSSIELPEDAYSIAKRVRELKFTSTVGILHDHEGQLKPLSGAQSAIHKRIIGLGTGLFSFAHYDSFQENIARAMPNSWHCPAGGRFLYICEDGLVHYCSQQRGRPGIPLLQYTREDILRESHRPKGCAPFCTISCVHQTAMLDDFRTKPRETLAGIIARRKERDPGWRLPLFVKCLEWAFLRNSRARDWFGAIALRTLRVRPRERSISK
jgi:MoaA/NifB/PqqE/SkfB family radical SAM enzyme